jgi:hypothetical protein
VPNYDVGYGKPPIDTRFKAGNREYLKRQQRAQKTENDVLRKFFENKVKYRKGGILKRASRLELLVRSTGTAAVSGDVAAAEALLTMRSKGVELGELSKTIITFGYIESLL